MKIWIYLNGIQQGPYTEDEIAAMELDAKTPVWYDGLSQWMPAAEAPVTAKLVAQKTFEAEDSFQKFETQASVGRTQTAVKVADERPCPPTYMGWAVFATICCCLPGGIIAIIYSTMTAGAYNKGDYDKAEKMSEYAQWAIILSIVLGLVCFPITSILF